MAPGDPARPPGAPDLPPGRRSWWGRSRGRAWAGQGLRCAKARPFSGTGGQSHLGRGRALRNSRGSSADREANSTTPTRDRDLRPGSSSLCPAGSQVHPDCRTSREARLAEQRTAGNTQRRLEGAAPDRDGCFPLRFYAAAASPSRLVPTTRHVPVTSVHGKETRPRQQRLKLRQMTLAPPFRCETTKRSSPSGPAWAFSCRSEKIVGFTKTTP